MSCIVRISKLPVRHSSHPCIPFLTFVCVVASLLGAICSGPCSAQERGKSSKESGFTVEWAWTAAQREQAKTGFWPQFRGPTGDGHADASANPPTQWSDSQNVAWAIPIEGKAWSSPIVWNNTVWVTNASEDGLRMSLLAIDRTTGKILYDRLIFENQKTQPDFHAFNSYGSPTPITDGEHVYVSFGAYGTAAVKAVDGTKVWERRDLSCNHFRGPGSSPILFHHLLICHMDGFDQQYVVALDKRTGQTVWRADREVEYGTDDGDVKKAFSTPQLIELADHSVQMISTTSKAVLAYDPNDGKVLWRVRYDEFSSTARPVNDGNKVYISTGFSKAKMYAIRLGGSGDITSTHLAWQSNRAIGSKPSPLLFDSVVCSVDDRGVMSAMDRETGETKWQVRLGGDFSASPILAANRIYCFDEAGKGHVYTTTGEPIAVNTLDSGCLASPAAVGNDLIVRTRTKLYCFRE